MSLFQKKVARLTVLFDNLSGRPTDIDAIEAKDLLRAGNVHPEDLKRRLYERLDNLAKRHAMKGQPLTPLLKQALGDFRPALASSRRERELIRNARSSIRHLIDQAKRVSSLLEELPELTFASAFRSKHSLSAADKQILEDLVKRLRTSTQHPKSKRLRRKGP